MEITANTRNILWTIHESETEAEKQQGKGFFFFIFHFIIYSERAD